MKLKERIKIFFVRLIGFLLNPRFLLCFGIAWMITNGWSYVFFFVGTFLQIGWMTAVGAAYLAFLWLPISPEKIVTLAIAVLLLKLIFPKDEKTLGLLRELSQQAHRAWNKKKGKKNAE